MRINGRLLRPSTLAERRLMLGHFGTDCIRVPRTLNPFAVARRKRLDPKTGVPRSFFLIDVVFAR